MSLPSVPRAASQRVHACAAAHVRFHAGAPSTRWTATDAGEIRSGMPQWVSYPVANWASLSPSFCRHAGETRLCGRGFVQVVHCAADKAEAERRQSRGHVRRESGEGHFLGVPCERALLAARHASEGGADFVRGAGEPPREASRRGEEGPHTKCKGLQALRC